MSLRSRFETHHVISPEVTGWTATTVLVPAPAPPDRTRIGVYSAVLGSSAATQFYFADSTGFPISGLMFVLANTTSLVLPVQDNMDPWFMTPSTRGLSLIVSSGGPLFGDVYWLPAPGDFRPVPETD